MIRSSIFLILLSLSLSAKGANNSFATSLTVELSRHDPISPLIYGQYLEHVQVEERCIYPSIWDDTSPLSNKSGLRKDVIAVAAEMKVPVVRWPGGCFADVYHWADGIGPRASRQPKPNRHWGGTESNMFGTPEFLEWCGLAGVEPYINVNLGSGTLEEALAWLEYCNGDMSSTQGKSRAADGRTKPWNVKYWGIGNETWGDWETGHTDAFTYGGMLKRWASAMKKQDPRTKVLGVGSEEGNDRTWDGTVLSHAANEIDFLTMHMYGISTNYTGEQFERFVYTPAYLETRLRRMIETIDQTTAPRTSKTPINISVDEWNIRHFFNGKQNRQSPRNLQDALFAAGVLNSFVRLSPRVAMANYVFLVNGNGTLLVDDKQVVKTPLAHVFERYAKWMTGTALDVRIEGPTIVPPQPLTAHPGRKPAPDYKAKPEPVVDSAAALRGDGAIAISLVNRDKDTTATVNLFLPPGYKSSEVWTLTGDDIYAVNDYSNASRVRPKLVSETSTVIHGPPHSLVLVRTNKGNQPATGTLTR